MSKTNYWRPEGADDWNAALTAAQVDGSISVSYRVESTNLTVTDSAHKVNDNDYHVVSFVRAGSAGVLRIDRHLVQSLQTPGAFSSSHRLHRPTDTRTFSWVSSDKLNGLCYLRQGIYDGIVRRLCLDIYSMFTCKQRTICLLFFTRHKCAYSL